MADSGIENFSRRALAALVVGLSGPAAGLLIVYLLGERVLFGSVDETADLGDAVVEGLLDLLRLVLVAGGAGALVTLAAFALTRARWAVFGWLGSLVVFPFWSQALTLLLDLGPVAYVFALGAAPGAVRLCLPTHPRVVAEVSPVPTDR